MSTTHHVHTDDDSEYCYLFSGICDASNKMIYAFPYSAMNLVEIDPAMGTVREIGLASVLEKDRSRFFEFCKPLSNGAIFAARSENDVQFWLMQYQPVQDIRFGMSNFMKELLNDSTYADVRVEVGGEGNNPYKVFNGHRVVLARVPFFDAALGGNFRESSEGKIVLNDIDPNAFQVVWNAIYGSPPDIKMLSANEILSVLDICERFGVRDLQTQLSQRLMHIVHRVYFTQKLNEMFVK